MLMIPALNKPPAFAADASAQTATEGLNDGKPNTALV
jgi:hypothetical protein